MKQFKLAWEFAFGAAFDAILGIERDQLPKDISLVIANRVGIEYAIQQKESK